ncbi:globin isoform X2 [Plodia interpunctella]|uniref:globin isoform X2 n=2 Tax=Plodia interpunctella TaxID=58824 RepID=UPI002368C144|nr:globin isoform X2 [Plodia interpunctella]
MLLSIYLSSIFLLIVGILVLKRRKIGTKHTMGGWFSYVWWGGDPDACDPISGLTKREIHAVQKSWAPVYANPVANGTELLKRFFRAYPNNKTYFKMLTNISEEQFSENIQFKAHVVNLMSSLNLAVKNLDQPEVVAALMVKIGDSHAKRHIKEQNFHELKDVIVKMYIEVLKLDATTLAAWGKAVDFWYKHIFVALNSSR